MRTLLTFPLYTAEIFLKQCYERSQNCKKTTICFVKSVRLSVSMEQLGAHWTNCQEI